MKINYPDKKSTNESTRESTRESTNDVINTIDKVNQAITSLKKGK